MLKIVIIIITTLVSVYMYISEVANIITVTLILTMMTLNLENKGRAHIGNYGLV